MSEWKGKQRCDHVLGLDGYGNMVLKSDKQEYAILDYFNFCPECGKKLIGTAKIENAERLI